MIDFMTKFSVETMILDILERNHVKDCKSLEDYEMELHEIIANICWEYSEDYEIEDYAPYF